MAKEWRKVCIYFSFRFDLLEALCYGRYQAQFRERVWTGVLRRFSVIATLRTSWTESAQDPEMREKADSV